MAQAPVRALYSPEDLLSMEEGDSFELDDGELVEVCVGAESQQVAGRVFARLDTFALSTNSGIALPPEIGLQIFANRRRVPRPDGGFISFERLGPRRLPKGFLTVAPELVIESVSPGDAATYLQRKVREYLGAGVRLVWVLYPDTRTAEVYRADNTGVVVQPNGDLDGEDVLPGFRCPLDDIMPPEDEVREGEQAL